MKVLVVVYNKSLYESLTLKSLRNIPGLEIFVADNSTSDYGNEKTALEYGCSYFSMGGNKGLSKAYNRVISTLDKSDEIICLFDDDTKVDKTYFDALYKDADKFKDIDIFAPVVKDRKGILSPCSFSGIRGKRVKRLEQIPLHRISVVNTGLAIRLKVFRDYCYDEGLFLDYIDHAFIRDVTNNDKSKIHILNAVLEQCFSASEKTKKQDALGRYSIFKSDLYYYCNKYGISSIRRRMILFTRRVRIIIKSIV